MCFSVVCGGCVVCCVMCVLLCDVCCVCVRVFVWSCACVLVCFAFAGVVCFVCMYECVCL